MVITISLLDTIARSTDVLPTPVPSRC